MIHLINMIKRIGLVLGFGFSFCNCFSQNPLVKQWDYRFGGELGEFFSVLQQTTDGGFILGGYSASDSSGEKTQGNWDSTLYHNDFWIVKTNELGNKQWDKRFGGIRGEQLYSLQQTNDGGYILGGDSYSDSSGDKTQNLWGVGGLKDYWIIKIDSLGNKEWDKDFGGNGGELFHSLHQTSDGGYILGGTSNSGISGDKTENTWGPDDYWIVKIDSLGNKQWDKDFGGTGHDYFNSLQQTNDGGYILGGYSDSGISGDKTQDTWGTYDYWIVKTDSTGNKQWDKDFGGTDFDALYSLQQTADGGFILGGTSYSGISGDKTQPSWGFRDFWIVKIDSLGNKQWDKDFGGTDYDEFYRVFQMSDGGYLISGDSYSPVSGDKTENNLGVEQTWIIKTDSLGNKLWDKTIFTPGHDEVGFAIQSNDGCYVIANYTDGGIGGYKTQPSLLDSVGDPTYDYWIVKFCDSTLTTTISTFNIQHSIFNISPNPTTGTIQLTFNTKHNGAVYCEIMNVMGERVYVKELQTLNFKLQTALDVSFLAKGIYFVKVIADGKSMVQKVVKM